MPDRAQLHKNLAVLALLAVLPVRAVFAQTSGAQGPPSTPEEELTKTVGFISVPCDKNKSVTCNKETGGTGYVTGTCFFVEVPDERLGKGQSFVYTVTNRHVATAEGVDPKSLLPEVFLRVNRASPENGSALAQGAVMLNGPVHWYFPSDDTVDLAVLPGTVKGAFDIKGIPVSFFATTDRMKSERIAVGDSVFFIGLFLQFPGTTRVDPIYRQGVIAMMPTDPIPMSDGIDQKSTKLEHLYLADAHAFHGNSGSPLFVQVSGVRNGSLMMVGGFPYQLLGVVNGFIPERNDIRVTGAATFESSNEPNSGILTFVPAQELKDLLYSPELQKLRDDIVASQRKP